MTGLLAIILGFSLLRASRRPVELRTRSWMVAAERSVIAPVSWLLELEAGVSASTAGVRVAGDGQRTPHTATLFMSSPL
ncbi:MAG: hypothetical protein H0W70_12095 [Actinobacteria bacterium]|nr:hypothetical protein [Actinomycetota bacterium]